MARALELLGDRWTLLILRDAMFGVTRFEELRERLGVARNILATRLDEMVANGLLTREPYDTARCRYDYVLTDKGRATWPVLMAIRQWGDKWITGEGHEPVQFGRDPAARREVETTGGDAFLDHRQQGTRAAHRRTPCNLWSSCSGRGRASRGRVRMISSNDVRPSLAL